MSRNQEQIRGGSIVTQQQTHNAPLRSMEATSVSSGAAARMTFLPTNMGEAMQLADLMAASNFVPGHLRGKPGDCLAVVIQSSLWGMNPYAVANKTYFVNDRMAYESQLVNAVVNSSNALDGRLSVDWQGEGQSLVCTVRGRIRGDNDTKERRVPISGLTVKNSPLWKQDPEQQLAYYATRAWARLYTPEVLMGVYTPEEVREMESASDVDGGTVKSTTLSVADLRRQAGRDVQADDESLEGDRAFLAGEGETADRAASDPAADAAVTGIAENVSEPEQGRSDEQHGDKHDGSDADGASPSEAETVRLIGMASQAKNRAQFFYTRKQLEISGPGLDHDQYDRVMAELQACATRLNLGPQAMTCPVEG